MSLSETVTGGVLTAGRERVRRGAHIAGRLAQTPRTFQNWSQVLWQLGPGARGADTLTFVTRDGVRMSCPNVPGARVPVYEVFAEDTYRFVETLAPYSDTPLRVVDIGAHVGAFACGLAARAPGATVWCFEPSPTSARFLRRNVAENGFADRITIAEQAVSGRRGTVVLSDNGGGSALNSVVPEPAVGAGIAVEATTFDDIVAAAGDVDIVKIDCEGGEYDLVLNSSPESWATVRHVVLEYHPSPEHDWAKLREWFRDHGLVVVEDRPDSAAQGTAWLARR